LFCEVRNQVQRIERWQQPHVRVNLRLHFWRYLLDKRIAVVVSLLHEWVSFQILNPRNDLFNLVLLLFDVLEHKFPLVLDSDLVYFRSI
jgi:hypothetical protein